MTIHALQEGYRKGWTSPEEVITYICQKAEEDDPYHIWILPPHLEWITPYLERLKDMDPLERPLWGVPFTIKDNLDLAGMKTTAGCPEYAYLADESAEVVKRLLKAGAIPVGKTNMDQFATGLVGTRTPYGEVLNAWQPELISGGSSAGAAVSVARGMAAFALGTDTAGSGRVPAALNGLVGYKPSLGAWPTQGCVPACASLDCVTVFTNTIEEAYLIDRIVRGKCDTDPWSRGYHMPESEKPWEILLPQQTPTFFGDYKERYFLAWERMVKRLEQTEIPIRKVNCELFERVAKTLYEGPCVAERWADLGDFVSQHSQEVFPVTRKVLFSGAADRYRASDVYQIQHWLKKKKIEVWRMLKNRLLILPTCGGTWSREQVRKDPIGTNSQMGRYTNHCNLLELSAIAMPAGWAAENLPFGITLFARGDQEGILKGGAFLLKKLDFE